MATRQRPFRRRPGASFAPDLPRFTPTFGRALCEAAGLADVPGTRRQRAALQAAVREELALYCELTPAERGEARPANPRAAVSELLRAAEGLLRAFGDLDADTAAALTSGPGGMDTTAWARDLHALWAKLVLLDHEFEKKERLGGSQQDLRRVTLARLIDVYKTHRGDDGDLLMFLRHACAFASLPLPKTEEKLIALISTLPTLA